MCCAQRSDPKDLHGIHISTSAHPFSSENILLVNILHFSGEFIPHSLLCPWSPPSKKDSRTNNVGCVLQLVACTWVVHQEKQTDSFISQQALKHVLPNAPPRHSFCSQVGKAGHGPVAKDAYKPASNPCVFRSFNHKLKCDKV